MKVFIYGFWGGFVEKEDPVNIDFFINLLNKTFNEECSVGTADESDILLESVFSSNTYLHYKKWKFTFCFSGESRQRVHNFCSKERLETLSLYNCVLCGERNHNNIVNVPLFVPYIYCNNYIENLENPLSINNIPKKDICVIVSNSGAADRNKFFDNLDNHFKIDYAGGYKNNVSRISASYNTKEFQDYVSQYKFIISMDNSKDDTYITEKITHGFLSGNIPVYWGSDFINDYFNKDRFINVENMENDTINKAIDNIKFLLDNPNEYIKKVNSPTFINNKLSRTLDNIVKDIKNTIFERKNNLIEQTYIISSPIFEKDRYDHIIDVFINNLGLKLHNISFHCPTYKTIMTEEFLKTKLENVLTDEQIESIMNNSRLKAEISLFYNHISTLKEIKKNYKDGYFLIFESDVIPNNNINNLNELLSVLDEKRDNWDIINIGTPFSYLLFNDYYLEDFSKETDKYRFIKKKCTRCTDSFIFSYNGVIKILNIIEKNINYNLPYDHYLNSIFDKYSDDIRIYWSIPSFFEQGSFNGMISKIG